jgi:hypothetical protein
MKPGPPNRWACSEGEREKPRPTLKSRVGHPNCLRRKRLSGDAVLLRERRQTMRAEKETARSPSTPARFLPLLPLLLLAAYAAICFTYGAVVLTSIFRGRAAAAIGAVISNTPLTYSAVNFSGRTPSGSVRTRSNTP